MSKPLIEDDNNSTVGGITAKNSYHRGNTQFEQSVKSGASKNTFMKKAMTMDSEVPFGSEAYKQKVSHMKKFNNKMRKANVARNKARTVVLQERRKMDGNFKGQQLFEKLIAFDGDKQVDMLKKYLNSFKPSVEEEIKPKREDIYAWRTRSPSKSPVRSPRNEQFVAQVPLYQRIKTGIEEDVKRKVANASKLKPIININT